METGVYFVSVDRDIDDVIRVNDGAFPANLLHFQVVVADLRDSQFV